MSGHAAGAGCGELGDHVSLDTLQTAVLNRLMCYGRDVLLGILQGIYNRAGLLMPQELLEFDDQILREMICAASLEPFGYEP